MQRLQLTAFGAPADVVTLDTVNGSLGLAPDEVLVRIEAAPLNRSDVMLIEGQYAVRPPFPFSLGAEGVGRVVQAGDHVEAELRGARVLILPTYEAGTWADEVVVARRNVVKVSDRADPLQLAMIGINPATAYLLLSRFARLMPGDWVGQTAANAAMGQYDIQFARMAGLKTLNVVRRGEAADQVRSAGGDRVVFQGEHLGEEIRQALGGEKLSLVLDTVGGAPVGELAKSLRDGGPIVGYGLQSGEFPSISRADLYFRGLSLHGFWLINWIRSAPRDEIASVYGRLAGLVADGALSAAVEATYPLGQYRRAIAHSLEEGRGGKILFQP